MIIGIGTDMVEIVRVEKACERDHFVQRIFTKEEQKKYDSGFRKAASDFAVKEAIVKMLGTGFGPVAAIEIEVLRDDKGKPFVNLYGNAKKLSDDMGIARIFVSITNTKKYVSAFVVGEGCND